nr:unnamed protein product [Callosobruchus chinensis]
MFKHWPKQFLQFILALLLLVYKVSYLCLSQHQQSLTLQQFYIDLKLLSIIPIYQTLHLSVGFIGDPTGQLYALAKSWEFDSGPKTLMGPETSSTTSIVGSRGMTPGTSPSRTFPSGDWLRYIQKDNVQKESIRTVKKEFMQKSDIPVKLQNLK